MNYPVKIKIIVLEINIYALNIKNLPNAKNKNKFQGVGRDGESPDDPFYTTIKVVIEETRGRLRASRVVLRGVWAIRVVLRARRFKFATTPVYVLHTQDSGFRGRPAGADINRGSGFDSPDTIYTRPFVLSKPCSSARAADLFHGPNQLQQNALVVFFPHRVAS